MEALASQEGWEKPLTGQSCPLLSLPRCLHLEPSGNPPRNNALSTRVHGPHPQKGEMAPTVR